MLQNCGGNDINFFKDFAIKVKFAHLHVENQLLYVYILLPHVDVCACTYTGIWESTVYCILSITWLFYVGRLGSDLFYQYSNALYAIRRLLVINQYHLIVYIFVITVSPTELTMVTDSFVTPLISPSTRNITNCTGGNPAMNKICPVAHKSSSSLSLRKKRPIMKKMVDNDNMEQMSLVSHH